MDERPSTLRSRCTVRPHAGTISILGPVGHDELLLAYASFRRRREWGRQIGIPGVIVWCPWEVWGRFLALTWPNLSLALHLPRRMNALRQVYQLSPMTIQVSVGLSKIKYDRPLPKALGRYISVPVTISRSCPHRHVNPEHERSPPLPIVPPRILPCLESTVSNPPALNTLPRAPGLGFPNLAHPAIPLAMKRRCSHLLRGMTCPWLIAETSKAHWHASISSRVTAGFSSLPDRSPAELLSSV
ncbi:hypothetical protein BKA56DRAFT_40301 [Ilyonectria sp. MPI-CAGE-AT-0026]|nr:hypothetical protein BKA56DRAFT_40301 [Ilyonectria sp. MPI-CAGE-AT-0026]